MARPGKSVLAPHSVEIETPPADGPGIVLGAPQRIVAGQDVKIVQKIRTVAGPRRVVCKICGTPQNEADCFECQRCHRWVCQGHKDLVHLVCMDCAEILVEAASRRGTADNAQSGVSASASAPRAAPRTVPPTSPTVIPTVATLSVQSNPGDAEVLVDSRPVGRTPLSYPIDLGAARQRQVEVVLRKDGHQSQAAMIQLGRGRVSQWHGVVLPRLSATSLPDPTEVTVKEIAVESFEVDVQPCIRPHVAIEGLPPLPPPVLEAAGMLEGLRRTIGALKDGVHPSLKKAQAAVHQARQQRQELSRSLDEFDAIAPSYVRKRLLDEIARNPESSATQLADLAPRVPTDSFLRLLCAVRQVQQATRVYEQTQATYESARQAKIAELQSQAKKIEHELLPELQRDLQEIVMDLFERARGGSGFPLEAWMKLEPLLAKRPYPWDQRSLLAMAEEMHRSWPDHRAWRKARAAGTTEALQDYLSAMPCGKHAAEAHALLGEQSPPAPNLPRDPVVRAALAESWSNDLGVSFRLIAPGQFVMGASPGDDAASATEKPPVTVAIERHFWAATFPLTSAVIRRFLEDKDADGTPESQLRRDRSFSGAFQSVGPRENVPAVGISARDAEVICQWLGRLDGRRYRLPTEAEWEYMARAGSAGAYWWTPHVAASPPAVFAASGPAPADPRRANAWGLIDVLGNVCEWTSSAWGRLNSGSATQAAGPLDSDARVARGGSWRAKHVLDLRVSQRRSMSMRTRTDDLGVRLVCDPS